GHHRCNLYSWPRCMPRRSDCTSPTQYLARKGCIHSKCSRCEPLDSRPQSDPSRLHQSKGSRLCLGTDVTGRVRCCFCRPKGILSALSRPIRGAAVSSGQHVVEEVFSADRTRGAPALATPCVRQRLRAFESGRNDCRTDGDWTNARSGKAAVADCSP